MKKKVVIAGGSGFIGRTLSRVLFENGYDVVVLSRNPGRAKPFLNNQVKLAFWDMAKPDSWQEHVSGACTVINLAGENIASSLRWSAAKKDRILQSRLDACGSVMEALKKADPRPRVLVQASAIGFYGNRYDEKLDETSVPGTGFLAETAGQWEEASRAVTALGVRQVIVRTGVVLGRDGGFLSRVNTPFNFFMGGHLGSGRQWISWIHIDDEAAAIKFLMERDDLAGPFNLTAPGPLKAKDFFQKLGRVLKRPSWFPVPGFVLQILLGELATELLLSGQRVFPRRLLQAGFDFKHKDAESALRQVLGA